MNAERQYRENLQRIVDALSTQDWNALNEVVDEFLVTDYVWHLPGIQDPICGPEAWKKVMRSVVEASPDYTATVEDVFVAGDKGAARFLLHRTDPTTGKRQRITGLLISHLKGGKLAEDWEVGSQWEDDA